MIDQKSIAVLPLENLSSDPENEYFADGMTEEIINALSKIEGLKVTARTSSFVFKNKKEDVRIIGNQLGVSTVLEGSIRKSGKRIRVTAQLIRTDNGFHIWSENFDRDLKDIFELQDEISLLIAEKIRENFGHLQIGDHLVETSTTNLEAYNTYLKARFNHLRWDEEGIQKAIALYSRCIELEPGYSAPHFGLAYCFAMAGSWNPEPELLVLAEEHIEKGFQITEQSALGYYAQATLSFWGHWDFQKAQEYYIKAIQLYPKYTEAEEGLIELYTAVGDFENALKHVDQILKINPLSTNHFFTKANIFYLQHDFDQAEYYLDQALQLSASFTHAIALKQLCLIQTGREKELIEFLDKTPLVERPKACLLLNELVRNNTVSDEAIQDVLQTDAGITLFPWNLFVQVQAGRLEEAKAELISSVERKVGQIVNFKHTPFLLPLHNEPEFHQLVAENFQGNYSHIEPIANQAKTTELIGKEESVPHIEELKKLMEEEKAYLENDITLRTIAEMIDLSPNKLSYLINEFIGTNFNEFINGYRLKAFQEKALEPQNGQLTLLGLAYESGFTSKSVFNEFFKKKLGQTPKQWLKSQQV